MDTGEAIFRYVGRRYGEWFPALGEEVYRTTSCRQAAADLWKVKEDLWRGLLPLAPHDPTFASSTTLSKASIRSRNSGAPSDASGSLIGGPEPRGFRLACRQWSRPTCVSPQVPQMGNP